MKLAVVTQDVESYGVLKETQYTIAPTAHVMAMLSGVYTDVKAAVVREYLTNMGDAYVKLPAGAPFIAPEIRLPNELHPFVEFKDFGTGMSKETMENVFTVFGATLKDDNDVEVGGLGIGAKAAFHYTQTGQFTVESRWNGIKYVASAHKNALGIPTLSHFPEVATDEPNGVTIRIPVPKSDWDQIKKLIHYYAQFFPLDLVIVGETVKKPEYILKGDSWGVAQQGNRDGGKVLVIMGGVPYDTGKFWQGANIFEYRTSNTDIDLHLYVPVSTFPFPPSREMLEKTDATDKTLKQLVKQAMQEAVEQINERLAQTTSPYEAFLEAKPFFKFRLGIDFNGSQINSDGIRLDLRKIDKTVHYTWNRFRSGLRRTELQKPYVDRVNYDPTHQVIVYDDGTTKNVGSRVRRYLENSSLDTSVILLTHPDTSLLSTVLLGAPYFLLRDLPPQQRSRHEQSRAKPCYIWGCSKRQAGFHKVLEIPEPPVYYVEMENGKLVGNGPLLVELSKRLNIPQVYALTKRGLQKYAKIKGWVHLEKHLQKILWDRKKEDQPTRLVLRRHKLPGWLYAVKLDNLYAGHRLKKPLTLLMETNNSSYSDPLSDLLVKIAWEEYEQQIETIDGDAIIDEIYNEYPVLKLISYVSNSDEHILNELLNSFPRTKRRK